LIKIMYKLVDRAVGAVLPTATAKASATKGRCVPGCAGDGVWIGSFLADGRRPCC
jgi:hypothetical protein